MNISKINTYITLDYLCNESESLYFERKSGNVSKDKIVNEIASFANANGGVIAVGISDDGIIEGFNKIGVDKLNSLQKVYNTLLNPSVNCIPEIIDIKNNNGEDDKILLFHINPSEYVIRNNKDEVYCRQGDSSFKLNSEQVKSLEYNRKDRNFESEVISCKCQYKNEQKWEFKLVQICKVDSYI